MYKTLKYVIEFPSIEDRKKLKIASIKMGIPMKTIIKYMIRNTLIEYSKGNVTKDKILETLNE